VAVMTRQVEERLVRLARAAEASKDAAKADQEARDAAIAEADAAGLGLREMARLTGLSPTQVQRILIRETAARQHA
jgi:AraC-like DNA-binding protein